MATWEVDVDIRDVGERADCDDAIAFIAGFADSGGGCITDTFVREVADSIMSMDDRSDRSTVIGLFSAVSDELTRRLLKADTIATDKSRRGPDDA